VEEDLGLFQYPEPQAFPGAPAMAPAPATPTDIERVPSSTLRHSQSLLRALRRHNPIQNRAHSLSVTRKGEEAEDGEEEEEEEEGESSGGVPLPLEPIGDIGMPMHLKLSSGASQMSNLAAIMDAFQTIMEIIKSTRTDDLPLTTL
jgi:hypothetical protein